MKPNETMESLCSKYWLTFNLVLHCTKTKIQYIIQCNCFVLHCTETHFCNFEHTSNIYKLKCNATVDNGRSWFQKLLCYLFQCTGHKKT